MASNEGEVYFKLVGEFDPDAVTKDLGIEPTSIRNKGRPLPEYDSWEYSQGKKSGELINVYEMSSSLVKLLEPKADAIAEAIKKYNLSAELQVVLWITMDESISTPTVGFDERTIQFLNKVGASIDVDTYRN